MPLWMTLVEWSARCILLLLVIFMSSCKTMQEEETYKAPNIILVMTHDQGVWRYF